MQRASDAGMPRRISGFFSNLGGFPSAKLPIFLDGFASFFLRVVGVTIVNCFHIRHFRVISRDVCDC